MKTKSPTVQDYPRMELSHAVGHRAAYVCPMPLVRNRWRFALRFIYWTARHGSTEHAAWAVQNEGWAWN